MPHFQPAAMPALISKDFITKNCIDFQLDEEEWDYTPMHGSFTSNSPASRSTDSFEPSFSPGQPVVAVIGCGYVGSHLAACFGKHFRVVALDVSEDRVRQLNEDTTYPSLVTFTTDPSKLREASHFLIAVPTGLKEDNSIDDSHLKAAIETVRRFARDGSTVVIESSVAVGMTRKLLQPMMVSKNLKGGMSPERIDPGRAEPPAHAIPKVISGLDDITPGSLESVNEIYSKAFDTVIMTTKPEVAEMTKLFENCQRMIMAAYANEMADACKLHDIDPFEVQSAAATKPFGYLPFTPGLGVGGHCIAVNPYYLFSNCPFPVLRAATRATSRRPQRVGRELLKKLKERKVQNPKILVVGAAFKAGQSSTINSPGIALMKSLKEAATVSFVDPLVPQQSIPWANRIDHTLQWNHETLSSFDAIVVAIKQPGISYDLLEQLDVLVEQYTS